jgi:lycopene cyclase CruA
MTQATHPSRDHVQKRVAESGGQELLERLLWLDARRHERLHEHVHEHLSGGTSTSRARAHRPAIAPLSAGQSLDWDVVIAGGGLSLLVAPLLAKSGVRVAVIEPFVAGKAHREWNASKRELDVLVTSGLLTRGELEHCTVARYDHGICRFHGGADHPVREALDHAVDAGRLLGLIRSRAESLGVRFLDGHVVLGEHASEHGVVLHVAHSHRAGPTARPETVTTSVMIDARGASSPYAHADLVCPTVGGVLTALREGDGPNEVNPAVGDILVTTEGAQATEVFRDGKPSRVHRQYVWEGFPGHPGHVTVYLFYYTLASESASLVELYDRFFETLPTYKRGDAKLVRPTFGFIPGWSRHTPAPHSPHRRIVLMGDAAARHSPLTFCGFGAMLRSFERVAQHVVELLQQGRTHHNGPQNASPVHDTALHRWTGALAYLLANGKLDRDQPNQLLDAAFATLHEMGNDAYAALLRDEMGAHEFVQFLRRTSTKRPQVYRDVFRSMGLTRIGRWGMHVLRDYARG